MPMSVPNLSVRYPIASRSGGLFSAHFVGCNDTAGCREISSEKSGGLTPPGSPGDVRRLFSRLGPFAAPSPATLLPI